MYNPAQMQLRELIEQAQVYEALGLVRDSAGALRRSIWTLGSDENDTDVIPPSGLRQGVGSEPLAEDPF